MKPKQQTVSNEVNTKMQPSFFFFFGGGGGRGGAEQGIRAPSFAPNFY